MSVVPLVVKLCHFSYIFAEEGDIGLLFQIQRTCCFCSYSCISIPWYYSPFYKKIKSTLCWWEETATVHTVARTVAAVWMGNWNFCTCTAVIQAFSTDFLKVSDKSKFQENWGNLRKPCEFQKCPTMLWGSRKDTTLSMALKLRQITSAKMVIN